MEVPRGKRPTGPSLDPKNLQLQIKVLSSGRRFQARRPATRVSVQAQGSAAEAALAPDVLAEIALGVLHQKVVSELSDMKQTIQTRGR